MEALQLPLANTLDGATRIHFIVGDPIAQVKSPAGVTALIQAQGRNAVCVPAHVAPRDLAAWFVGISAQANVDSVLVTVPHKFACFSQCKTTTPRAAFVGAVNVMRRNTDGSWHGDMCDGQAFVAAVSQAGGVPNGARALLVGAGGAGSAIAHAFVNAGVRAIAIHDADASRRDALIARLTTLDRCSIEIGSIDPSGFDIAANATPMGMTNTDPFPIKIAEIAPQVFVGCVVTAPAVPPMIAAARMAGCKTSTGIDMFAQVRGLLVDFLLEKSCAPT